MKSPCKCGNEPPGSISHGVSLVIMKVVEIPLTIPLGRARGGWEDNMKMDLKEIGVNTRNWFDSVQNRYYWRTVINAA